MRWLFKLFKWLDDHFSVQVDADGVEVSWVYESD